MKLNNIVISITLVWYCLFVRNIFCSDLIVTSYSDIENTTYNLDDLNTDLFNHIIPIPKLLHSTGIIQEGLASINALRSVNKHLYEILTEKYSLLIYEQLRGPYGLSDEECISLPPICGNTVLKNKLKIGREIKEIAEKYSKKQIDDELADTQQEVENFKVEVNNVLSYHNYDHGFLTTDHSPLNYTWWCESVLLKKNSLMSLAGLLLITKPHLGYFLLEKGAKPDECRINTSYLSEDQGLTELALCLKNSYKQGIKLLLEKKANPHLCAFDGRSFLKRYKNLFEENGAQSVYSISSKQQKESDYSKNMAYIFSLGNNHVNEDKYTGKIICELPLRLRSYMRIPVLEYLFLYNKVLPEKLRVLIPVLMDDMGIDPNTIGMQGNTILNRSMCDLDSSCVELLLDSARKITIDVNALDKKYRSALFYAVYCKKFEVVEILIRNHANIFSHTLQNGHHVYSPILAAIDRSKTDKHETLQHCIRIVEKERGKQEVVKLLNENPSKHFFTLLDAPILSGRPDMLKWLIDEGVEVNNKLYKNNNLLIYAFNRVGSLNRTDKINDAFNCVSVLVNAGILCPVEDVIKALESHKKILNDKRFIELIVEKKVGKEAMLNEEYYQKIRQTAKTSYVLEALEKYVLKESFSQARTHRAMENDSKSEKIEDYSQEQSNKKISFLPFGYGKNIFMFTKRKVTTPQNTSFIFPSLIQSDDQQKIEKQFDQRVDYLRFGYIQNVLAAIIEKHLNKKTNTLSNIFSLLWILYFTQF